MRIANSVAVDYVWSKDWFFVFKETEETQNFAYLKVEMDVGDNVEDEWMVACVLMEVSKQIHSVAVSLRLCTQARFKSRTRTAISSSSKQRSCSPIGWIRK